MILSGWKEIAGYLHCGVRTVQRWEAEGLPIHRPSPAKRSHVIAHSEELDRWVRNGCSELGYPHVSAQLPVPRDCRMRLEPNWFSSKCACPDFGPRWPNSRRDGRVTLFHKQ